jgi:hypothetical protein
MRTLLWYTPLFMVVCSAPVQAQTTLKCGGYAPDATPGTGWPLRPFRVYVANSGVVLDCKSHTRPQPP